MSLILEALKKSEAERNLGRVPGLLTPAPRIDAARDYRLPVLLALLAAVALGMGATWWWLAPGPAGSGDASVATDAEPGTAAAPAAVAEQSPQPAQAARSSQTTAPGPQAPAGAAASRRSATTLGHATSDVPAPRTATAVTPSDPAFRSVERESAALPAGAQVPGAATVQRTQVVPAARAPARSTAGVDPAPPRPTTAVDAVLPPPAGVPVTADTANGTASTVAAAPAEALPGLRDLSADERAALPPLKLSMHVFAEEPAGRFVLIDGRRYTEGMAVAQGLVLHEIRRDGVVLELDGRRFLLSRPG